MIFQKATGKTMFKPSFGGKKGTTDFFHVMLDSFRAAEIEVKPISKDGHPEILSLYSDVREKGVGRFCVEKTLELYLEDKVYVMTTKESKPFWIKMGAVEFDGDMCVFIK